MKKGMKKAFTLTELLIGLAVIGILVAILLPIIFNILPDQNALMAKRAYYTVQTVVSDLINDEACYPDQTALGKKGFDDGYGYINCQKWGADDHTKISNEDAFSKFVTLVTDKLEIKGEPTINSNNATFTTKDGFVWNVLYKNNTNASGYSTVVEDFFAVITVDVNGSEKPSCGQSQVTAGCNPAITKGFDQFGIVLGADGKLEILDAWARSAVKVNKDIAGNENDIDDDHTIQSGETTNESGTEDDTPSTSYTHSEYDSDGYDTDGHKCQGDWFNYNGNGYCSTEDSDEYSKAYQVHFCEKNPTSESCNQ